MLTSDEIDDIRSDLVPELPDVVTIRRQEGSTVDPVTLEEVPNWTVLYANQAALVVWRSREGRFVEEGDTQVGITDFAVTVPADVVDVVKGDQIVVVDCHDPAAVGKTLTVTFAGFGSLSISRRISCQEAD